jgi:lysine/ornithine N-monooxygenase
VFPAIQSFQEHGVQFIDGKTESFDIVILATGYKSNVPYWLKVLKVYIKNRSLCT